MNTSNTTQYQPLGATMAAPSGLPDSTARWAAEADVPLEWNVGDVILDTYEVTGILGEGGMGKVYQVHNRGWKIDLAVKCPKPEVVETTTQDTAKTVAQDGRIESFVREAETWVELGLHPHIVSCYYVRVLGGVPRIFVECVEGGSLEDWITQGKLYEGGKEKALERMLGVAIQFAWGLHYAHEQGLVHQDVKPHNVMITPDGTAKVTDFGLAQARAAMGKAAVATPQMGRSIVVPGVGLMTREYRSPEQAAGQPLTRKTDIWSWGVSILEMFVGELTWIAGEAAAEVLASYLKVGPENANVPIMPSTLVELLQRCFQINSEARPKDMQAIAVKLQEIYQLETGRPYPQQIPEAAELRADNLNNKAVSLLDLGKYEEAEKLWKEALRIEPHHPESTYNRGLILWRSARMTDEALVRELKEIQKSPTKEWIIDYLLGLVHLERDDCESALGALENIEGTITAREEVQSALSIAQERLRQSKRLLRTFEGHTEEVSSVFLSQDNRYALSGGHDNTLKLWDIATGCCLRTFEGHTKWVSSVCLGPNSQYALSGSWDHTIKLWDVATGDCLRTFEGDGEVSSVCISSDGQYVLSGGGDRTLKLWEVATGSCLRVFRGHTNWVWSVCLSQDDRYALSGSDDDTCRLWDVATGQCLRAFKGDRYIYLSSNGQFALCNRGHNAETLTLWDVATGHCLRTFEGHIDWIRSVYLSSDSRYAISGSWDRTLRLWNVATGRCLRTFEGHAGIVESVCLSQDGRYALSGSKDHTLKLWAISSTMETYLAPIVLSHIQTSETALTVRVTYQDELKKAQTEQTQGNYVAAARHIREARSQPGYSRSVEAMNAWAGLYTYLPRKVFIDGWEVLTFEGHASGPQSICISQDGRYILSAGGTRQLKHNKLKLWETTTGRCLRTFGEHWDQITSAYMSSDARYALSSSGDRTLKLWDVATGRCLRTFQGHTEWVGSACLSQDNRYALSGASDNTVKLWEVATGRCLRTFEGHTKWVGAVCLSYDSRYAVSGSWDHTSKLWEMATGRCLRTFEGHTGPIESVCLTHNNRFLLSGSADNTIKLWDVATSRCLRTFEGHTGLVTSVCLSQDGHYAFSGSFDKTVRLWEIATGQCLRIFEEHSKFVGSVCLSLDSRYVISGSDDQTLKLRFLDWELEEIQSVDWDEGARPYLETFLTLRTPYVGVLPRSRRPAEEEITLALTRQGRPVWTEKDFERLLYTLGYAGYGWLRPEGVRRELEKMAREWQGPSPLPSL